MHSVCFLFVYVLFLTPCSAQDDEIFHPDHTGRVILANTVSSDFPEVSDEDLEHAYQADDDDSALWWNGQEIPGRRLGKSNFLPDPPPQPAPTCYRPCERYARPLLCYYRFRVEAYATMGRACGDCPRNVTACTSPQCITGDGYERSVLAVNRRMPGPSIQVCEGDVVVVDVKNMMPGRSTSIHWHGIKQRGTPHMDGVSMITQCPITEGSIFRYRFVAKDPGTHMWYSHDGFQKLDGVLGSLVVRIPREKDPSSRHYDYDLKAHTILISDWMHTTADSRYPGNIHYNTSQLPDSYLINGRGGYRGLEQNQTQNSTTNRPRPHHGLAPHGQDHGLHHFLHRFTHGLTTPAPRQDLEGAKTISGDPSNDVQGNLFQAEYPTLQEFPAEISKQERGIGQSFPRDEPTAPLGSTMAEVPLSLKEDPDSSEFLKRSLPFLHKPDPSVEDARTLHHLVHLFRGTQGPETPYALFRVTPGKRYRFRLIAGTSTMCPVLFTIEKHRLIVIAADGDPVKALPVDSITLFPGERYDIVVTAEQHPGSYWIHVRGTGVCAFVGAYQVAVLRYSGLGNVMPATPNPRRFGLSTGVILNPENNVCRTEVERFACVRNLDSLSPMRPGLLRTQPDTRIILNFRLHAFSEMGLFRSGTFQRFYMMPSFPPTTSVINNMSNLLPPSPLINQLDDVPDNLFCSLDAPCRVNGLCECLHMIHIPLGYDTEVVIADMNPVPGAVSNPFHLHGHSFRVAAQGLLFGRSGFDIARNMAAGRWPAADGSPPLKDTVAVPSAGFVVLRFLASNPGYWMLSCNYLYRSITGMSVVLQVGAPDQIPRPPVGFPRCGDFLPVD